MATEFNYIARLDTTQIMSGLAEIRAQVGMAFGSPTGFTGPSAALAGGGFSGFSNQSNVQAGLSAQFQQMFTGMRGAGNMFGGTWTNPAMAYSPHYGMVQAQSSLDQEWYVHRYGLGAAQAMKPPGMSAAEYGLGMEGNFIDRQISARHSANMAMQSTLYSGIGGMAAGEAASAIATPLGAMAGSAIASRLFGAGAAGAGGMIGGLAAGWFAFDAASDYVGGRIQKHYADIEQIQGVTRELGELAGAGRGLNRSQRTELGISARSAAGDLRMDVQEMGDILSLGRESGMLPTATDPSKARDQFREFARSIEEGAQVLHTSLANATQVIKTAIAHGQTAQEGIVKAAAYGGAEQYLQISAFGSMGAQVGRSMGYTGSQGSGVFMGALGGVGGAGLSYEEMRIMGGRFAAAQFVGQTSLAMAQSPLGNAQLMAAMGGGNMSGMGMMDVAGAALAGLGSGGGDMMSNMGRFMVHQNELRRGIGAGGVRTMVRQQLEMGGDLISEFMPDLSANEAQRLYAQSMGMNPDQAKLFVGAQGHRGYGVGSAGQMRAIDALQGTILSQNFNPPPTSGGPAEFGWGDAKSGAMIGAGIGSFFDGIGAVPGAAIGGAIGFVEGNASAIKEAFDPNGPGLFASAREKADYYERKMSAEYDARMAEAKQKIGYVDIDVAAGARFLRAGDLSNARLNFDAGASSPLASMMTGNMMNSMGLSPVRAGAGTIYINGQYYSAKDVQAMGRRNLYSKQASEQQRINVVSAAAEVAYGGSNLNQKDLNNDIELFGALYRMTATGDKQTAHLMDENPNGSMRNYDVTYDPNRVGDYGSKLLARAKGFVEKIDAKGQNGALRARMLQKLDNAGGLLDPEVHAYLESVTGQKLDDLQGAFMAGRAGAVGTKAAVDSTMTAEAQYLRASYGGQRRDAFGNMTNDEIATGVYYKELVKDPYYLAAKEAVVKGKDDEAKKLLQQARADVYVAHADQLRYLNTGDIDPNEKRLRPGAEAQATDLKANMAQAIMQGNTALAGMDAVMVQNIMKKTSWSEQVKAEAAMLKGLKPPRRKRGPGSLQHAIGFGQQESAMSSIQRSLKSTENSLRALEKRISAMPTPQGSADGQTTTGGKT